MELRQLGPNGPRVSPLALGGTKFGRREDVKYPSSFELPTDGALSELFDLAKDQGINLVDTAPAYGSSEARIGKLVGRDDHWHIATKVGETFVDGRSSFDFSPSAIRASVENSRQQLGRDVLDLVLLHLSNDDMEILGNGAALSTLLELQAQGVISTVGASTKTVAAGLLAITCCDLVMITLNDSDQSQLPVLETARTKRRGVFIKKPLNSGHHSNVGASLAKLVCVPGVTSVVAGTISVEHLKENCVAVKAALEARI